jgi:hypothetical protein
VRELSTLAPIFTEVLPALQVPEHSPPDSVDTAAGVVSRRLPGVPEAAVATALRWLQLLGLVALPYLGAVVTPRVTAEPREWITTGGLSALAWCPRVAET